MRCRRCGAEMPEGALRCEECGAEIRIVPDYNPLDDVLAAQVKGAIDGSDTPLDDYDYQTSTIPTARRNSGTRGGQSSRRTSSGQRRTSSGQRRPKREDRSRRQLTPQEERRRRVARKKALKKKKRKRALLLTGIFLVILVIAGLIMYQFSYNGYVKKGYKALSSKDYTEAETQFKKAIKKKPKKAEAYEGLSELYIEQNESDKAEEILLSAVDKYSDSVDVYKACFKFYEDTKNQGEIPLILDGAKSSVADQLTEYASDSPEFSLDDSESFDDVQQLSLTTTEKNIYYTDDGSDPFSSKTRIKYEKPIQIFEGETEIKAVSVNANGIPSLTVSKTYEVELPIEDAPAVSPSTGQYDTDTKISIVVPDGYTAYYTTDGSTPDEDSEEYTDPISMPEGTTIFKAVLVNGKGRLSGVTTRNYERTE